VVGRAFMDTVWTAAGRASRSGTAACRDGGAVAAGETESLRWGWPAALSGR
jgi:hypothetical protein